MKSIPLLLIITLLFATAVLAAPNDGGCCINPNALACDITTEGECCPEGGYDIDFGPGDQDECIVSWFHASNDPSICAEMDSSYENAQYCAMGTCCGRNKDITTAIHCLNDGWISFNSNLDCGESTTITTKECGKGSFSLCR